MGYISSVWLGVLVFISIHGYGNIRLCEASSRVIQAPDQIYRTDYHFQPAKYWMNDPNVVEDTTVLMFGSVREISGVNTKQADVEMSFSAKTLEKAEKWEANWTNSQQVCSIKGASVKGGLGPFGLLVLASKDMQEYTAIFFRIFRGDNNNFIVLMCSDQTRSSLHLPSSDYDKTTYGAFLNVDPLQEKLSLRTLIDHSIVESFGGEGKACITDRVYPTNLAVDGATHLYVFNNGSQSVDISKLTVWSMKTAQIN